MESHFMIGGVFILVIAVLTWVYYSWPTQTQENSFMIGVVLVIAVLTWLYYYRHNRQTQNQMSVEGVLVNESEIGTLNIFNNPAAVGSKGTQSDPDVNDIIRKYLRERQETMLSTAHRLTPPTWNSEYEIDLTKMFTELVLVKDNRTEEDRTSKPCTLQGLFDAINLLEPCKMLVEGDGGMGKTTLLKYIAHLWATQEQRKPFKEKIVFLINIRDLEQGEDVLDSIMKQIKLKDFNRKTKFKLENKDKLQDFIINHDNEILILLDGYDELDATFTKDNPILSLFKKTDLKRCNVILTSRSGKLGEFVKLCNIHIEVKGFNKENVERYIEQYFTAQNKRELGKYIFGENRYVHSNINDNDGDCDSTHQKEGTDILELCKAPMFLLHICTVWRDKHSLPDNMSDLFRDLFLCIINQFIRTTDDEERVSEFSKIPIKFQNAILLLGQCIYEGLKQNKLTIVKNYLMGTKEDIEFALRIGFLYEETIFSEHNEHPVKKVYTTPHKLFSESLAGFYLFQQIRQSGFSKTEWKEIIYNDYLHNARVIAIGFLGKDSSKLLCHWITQDDANLIISLAKYFGYVKKEYKDDVLRALDKHMELVDFKLKPYISEVKEVLIKHTRSYSKHALNVNKHLLEIIGMYGKKHFLKFNSLSEFSLKDLIYSSIAVENHTRHLEFIGYNCCNKEYIENVLAECQKIGLVFNVTHLSFNDTLITEAFLEHLFTIAPGLSILYLTNCYITGSMVDNMVNTLWNNQQTLEITELSLENNDLSNISITTLIRLVKLAPKLKSLKLRSCQLSAPVLKKFISECRASNIRLKRNLLYFDSNDFLDNDGASAAHILHSCNNLTNQRQCELCFERTCFYVSHIINKNNIEGFINECIECNLEFDDVNDLHLCGINLSSLDAKTLACILRIFPSMSVLVFKKCQLSGSIVRDFFNECQGSGVELKSLQISFTENNLSDIDSKSLITLMHMSGPITWSRHRLKADNLKSFIHGCIEHQIKFKFSKVNLSHTNLATIGGYEMARLLMVFPNLDELDLTECNITGTVFGEFLEKCKESGIRLKFHMILVDNDLSDIDGISLLRMLKFGLWAKRWKRDEFHWRQYHLKAENLRQLLTKCICNETKLSNIELNLNDVNLSELTGETLALIPIVLPNCQINLCKCRLSGKAVGDAIEECQKKSIKWNSKLIRLSRNNLSSIDIKSLVILMESDDTRTFRWNTYFLTVKNITNVLLHCQEFDRKLNITELDLSNTDLSTASGTLLASIWVVMPKCKVNMDNCNLSGRIVGDIMSECKRIKIDFKCNMISINDNDLSEIDSKSFAALFRMKYVGQKSYNWKKIVDELKGYNLSFDTIQILLCAQFLKDSKITEWRDLVRSVDKLHDLIHECDRCSIELECIEVNLSNMDLSGANGKILALLWRICPKLEKLNMTMCNLSGKIIVDLINECNRQCIELKPGMIVITDNNLSDIDDASLAKIITT